MLPYETIVLSSALKIEELRNNMKGTLEPKEYLRFFKTTSNDYEGEIQDNTFQINRIIGYRNSFLPRITGQFINKNNHREIHIKMKLHPSVIVFLIFWIGFAFSIFLVTLIASANKGKFEISSLMPLGMILFAYILTMGAFKFESSKSKNDFKRIFNAELKEK